MGKKRKCNVPVQRQIQGFSIQSKDPGVRHISTLMVSPNREDKIFSMHLNPTV